MIRVMTVFNDLNLFHPANLFGRESAEFVFRNEPVLITAAVRELATTQEEYPARPNHEPIVQPRWSVTTEKEKRPELRMSWSVARKQ